MHKHLSLSLAALLTVPSAACTGSSGTSGTDDTQTVTSNLEKANGGFDTTDEAPAFGDESAVAAAAIEGDASASDALATDPATVAMEQASAASGFRLAIVWGKLPADPGATVARTWTGSLKVSRGGLIVRRTIGFEPATDHLLPRVSLDTVSFASVTKPYVDGLALTVLDPTPSATDAQTLTYSPADGSTSYTLDLSQLTAGPIVVDAGNGFQIVAVGRPRQVAACDGGFMRGRWHALSAHLGTYLGIVTDLDGLPVGHVRGVYGDRRNGDPVMFGKFIDAEGNFRGLIAGSFGSGEYQATWIDRAGVHGALDGAYFAGATASSGMFLGSWTAASCQP